MSRIRALAKESLIYGVSSIASRFLNFLLVPFYTHVMAPAEFGVVNIVVVVTAFRGVVSQCGFDSAYLRVGADCEGADGARQESVPRRRRLALRQALDLGASCCQKINALQTGSYAIGTMRTILISATMTTHRVSVAEALSRLGRRAWITLLVGVMLAIKASRIQAHLMEIHGQEEESDECHERVACEDS